MQGYAGAKKTEAKALSDFRDFVARKLIRDNPDVSMAEVRNAVCSVLNSNLVREQVLEFLEYWQGNNYQ